jgi:hypothetical protein
VGPSLFGRSIRAAAFGIDRFVRNFSFEAEPLVSFRLALFATPSSIRSSQVTRSVRIASTLDLGLVGFFSFRIPAHVRLALGSPV